MAAVDVILVVAALLWIFVVMAALGFGCVAMVRVRKRRRAMNQFFDAVRIPMQVGGHIVLLAGRKVAPRLLALIGELRSGGPQALPSRTRHR